jgi:O-antigen/teichoic acid export membrane protein
MNYLKLIGKPKTSMLMLLILSGVNIACSFLYTGVFKMGIKGIALALASGYFCAVVFGMFRLHRIDSVFKFKFIKPGLPMCLLAFKNGSPAALNNLFRAIQNFSVNFAIATFIIGGAGKYLPVFSVFNSFYGVISAVIFGISQAVLPLFTIAHGEHDRQTIKVIIKRTLLTGFIVVSALCLLLAIFGSELVKHFGLTNQAQLNSLGHALIFLLISANFFLINFLLQNYYNAIRKAKLAMLIPLLRLVAFMVIPMLVLTAIEKSIYAVWTSYIIGEILTLLSLFFITKRLNFNNNTRGILLFGKREITAIDFSVLVNSEAAVNASEKISEFCDSADISPKQAMSISLAIEEIIMLVSEHSFGQNALLNKPNEYLDMRIVKIPPTSKNSESKVIMRIRYGGQQFNPLRYAYSHIDDIGSDALGMNIILKLTENMIYNRSFGVNNLMIEV